MTVKIAPSLLSADFTRLREEIRLIEQAGADWIHLDIMDGHFVPALTFGPAVVKALRPRTRLLMDVHLMVENPERLLEQFYQAGADLITVHAESTPHLHGLLQSIRRRGLKAGVALNPATPVGVLDYLWELLDLVLVMSVNPGSAGQEFIRAVLPKLSYVAGQARARALPLELQVDGGINRKTAPLALQAGATVLVAGSAIFGAADGYDLIHAFKRMGSSTMV